MTNENNDIGNAVEDYINELSGKDVKEPENHQAGTEEEVKEPEQKKDEKPENYEIRLEKFKKQRDEQMAKNQELESRIAHLQGQIETVLKLGQQPEQDPTEMMDDVQKALYLELQKAKQDQAKMAEMLASVENRARQQEYTTREDMFFKSNPQYDTEDKKQEARDTMIEYAKANPKVGKLLLDGEISLNEVHTLALIKSGKLPNLQSKAQDSTKVFGNGKTEQPSSNVASEGISNVEKAIKILRNKESTNKGEASNVLIDSFADSVIEGMKRQ